jgi:hypothetical protein
MQAGEKNGIVRRELEDGKSRGARIVFYPTELLDRNAEAV